jgi:hypothetical protein
MKYSKFIFAASVAMIFVACDTFRTDNECKCKRYDNALYVSYETLSEVDSVQFFLNKVRVCSDLTRDNSIGTLLKTTAGCYGNKETHEILGDCSWGEKSAEGFPQISLFECHLNKNCDNVDIDTAEIEIRVFISDSTGISYQDVDSLPKISANNRIYILPEADTAFVNQWYPVSKGNNVTTDFLGCPGGFCVIQVPDDSIVCAKLVCTLGDPNMCKDFLY